MSFPIGGYLRRVVLGFGANILFNARLYRSFNFEFHPPFCFAEDTFPTFIQTIITLAIIDLITPIWLAVLDTTLQRGVLQYSWLFSRGHNDTCWEKNFLVQLSYQEISTDTFSFIGNKWQTVATRVEVVLDVQSKYDTFQNVCFYYFVLYLSVTVFDEVNFNYSELDLPLFKGHNSRKWLLISQSQDCEFEYCCYLWKLVVLFQRYWKTDCIWNCL